MIGGRLRTGELLASLGLLGLLATLFLRLFAVDADGACADDPISPPVCADTIREHATGLGRGWGTLGHPWLELVAIAAAWLLVVVVLAVRARAGRPTYGAVVSTVLGVFVVGLVLLLTAIRSLLAQPGAGYRLPDGTVVTVGTSVAAGGWLLLASLLVGLVGLWVAIADDRPRASEGALAPPPERLAPSRRDAPTAAAEPGA
ncbi:hypothetical protein [Patulibacter sp. SYSU D01012]|uniref:hypothetical protein n=1 Tax=Patulibacter sp. SYSU D01012 TaxID=2817381 RepID=UPI001B30EE95|nr:hypothetical protein [Patulibacter sp. SYSU D01012]